MTLATVSRSRADGDTVIFAMASVGLRTHRRRTATSPEPKPRVVSPSTNCMVEVVIVTMLTFPAAQGLLVDLESGDDARHGFSLKGGWRHRYIRDGERGTAHPQAPYGDIARTKTEGSQSIHELHGGGGDSHHG